MSRHPIYLNFKSVEIKSSKMGRSRKDDDLTRKQEIHSIQLITNFEYTNYYPDDIIVTRKCVVQMLLFYMIRENNDILALNWYFTNTKGDFPFTEDEFIILLKKYLLDMLYSPEKFNNFQIEIN